MPADISDNLGNVEVGAARVGDMADVKSGGAGLLRSTEVARIILLESMASEDGKPLFKTSALWSSTEC